MNATDTTADNFQMSLQALDIAARLEDAQRAVNYLTSLLEAWDELPDAERREEVSIALERLTRTRA